MIDVGSLKQVEESLCQVASQADEKFMDLDQEVKALHVELNAYRTENISLSHRVFEVEEKLSLYSIPSKKFNFTLEGVPEADNQKEDILSVLTDKINEWAKTKISMEDFSSASRQGLFVPNAKRPRSISIVVKNEDARNLLLRSRGKLAKDKIWIMRTCLPLIDAGKICWGTLLRKRRPKDTVRCIYANYNQQWLSLLLSMDSSLKYGHCIFSIWRYPLQ